MSLLSRFRRQRPPPPGPEKAQASMTYENFRQSRTNAIPFAVQPVRTPVQRLVALHTGFDDFGGSNAGGRAGATRTGVTGCSPRQRWPSTEPRKSRRRISERMLTSVVDEGAL